MEDDHAFKKALDIARQFSPLGRYPTGFNTRYKIKSTPAYGGDDSQGVFTKKRIKAGAYIGELRGRIDTKERTRRTAHVSNYALEVRTPPGRFHYELLCHQKHNSSWLRMINRPNAGEVANVEFVLCEYPMPRGVRPCGSFRVAVVATRAIASGRQLLAHYDLEIDDEEDDEEDDE